MIDDRHQNSIPNAAKGQYAHLEPRDPNDRPDDNDLSEERLDDDFDVATAREQIHEERRAGAADEDGPN